MRLLAACIPLMILPFVSGAADAQTEGPKCGPRAATVAFLGERYREVVTHAGLAANGALVEILSNAATGSWTMLATTPDGVSCMFASGEMWMPEVAAALAPTGDGL